MQMEDTSNMFGAVDDNSAIPTLGNGIETSLQFSEVQEPEEPKDVNQYLEYMRQKREALERAATLETAPTEEVVASVVEETSETEPAEEAHEETKNEEGENMKKKDEMETDIRVESADGEASIEDMVAQAMQKDEILLYQQKYLDSLEARKNKVDTIISMLQKEKETIDAQIQAVK